MLKSRDKLDKCRSIHVLYGFSMYTISCRVAKGSKEDISVVLSVYGAGFELASSGF